MSMVDEMPRERAARYLKAIYAAKLGTGENIPCKIEEGLYLGSVEAARNRDELKSLNITHVLIVARSLTPAFPDEFVYKKIGVLDSLDTNLREHFDECFDFIDEARRAGGGVLVHCFAGRSRSATIILAYLMKKHNTSLSQTVTLVKSKRPQIAPNHGFMIQLEDFEKSLGEYSSKTETMEKDENFGCEACVNVVFSLPIEKGSRFFYRCLVILGKREDCRRMLMALKDPVLQLGYLQALVDDIDMACI